MARCILGDGDGPDFCSKVIPEYHRTSEIPQTAGFWEQSNQKMLQTSGTAVQAFVYNAVRSSFQHQTHHLSAFHFSRKRNKILPNTIMNTAIACFSGTSLDAIGWRCGCSWWRWRDNGRGEQWRLGEFWWLTLYGASLSLCYIDMDRCWKKLKLGSIEVKCNSCLFWRNSKTWHSTIVSRWSLL